MFNNAVRETALNRETSYIFEDIEKRIADIEISEDLKKLWGNYTKNYRYAEDITYEDVISVLKH